MRVLTGGCSLIRNCSLAKKFYEKMRPISWGLHEDVGLGFQVRFPSFY